MPVMSAMPRRLGLFAPDPARLLVTDVDPDIAAAALHEAGHVVLIEHIGGRPIGRARIFADGSGHACDDYWVLPDTPVECLIAVYLAGPMAQGVHLDHWDGSGDKEAVREYLDELSLDEGLKAMQRARSIARFGLQTHAKRMAQIARRLERTGRA
jgi:hypothetical protein